MSATQLFSIPNLSSSQVTPCEPWKASSHAPPAGMTKEQFSRWATSPTTNGVFVSGFEGLNPHIRVSETNKPYKMHGLIADFDVTLSEQELRDGLTSRSKANLRPAFAHRTFSGRGRVVWLFEKPLLLPEKLVEPFLKVLHKELGVNRLFGGLDDAFFKPSQYYHWMVPAIEFSTDRISSTSLHFWMGRACEATRRYRGEGALEIPFDVVHAAIDEKYPGRWTGPFIKDARGVCFWNPDSTNPTSAIVTETGMLAFSQEKPFYTWADLLGVQWVQQFEQDRLGKPLESFYFDGRYYWSKDAGNIWRPATKEDTRQKIADNFGLSLAPHARGVLSEVDRALVKIREVRVVDKAYPVLYSEKDTAWLCGELVLNVSRIKPVAPVGQPVAWGEGFPWIADFLFNLFDPADSVEHLYSWLHRSYKGALEYKLPQGQAIFIAGGVGRGKTLFSNRIVGQLMGGCEEATDFLLGDTAWNAALLHSPVWVVDDAKSTTNYEKHRVWSAMIKKSVANTKHPYNMKFRDSATVEWNGRIICSLNDDPESIRQIPHTDGSVLDKIMLFKANDIRPNFPPNHILEATITAELPYFARWLADYVIPDGLRGSNRFGIKSYHHPVLLEEARLASPYNNFAELLDQFLSEYMIDEPEKTHWRGTATKLIGEMNNTLSIRDLCWPYLRNTQLVGLCLAQLASTTDRVRRGRSGERQWVIELASKSLLGQEEEDPLLLTASL